MAKDWKTLPFTSIQNEEGELKYLSYTFPSTLRQVELFHLTDLQYGARSFKPQRFEEYVKWILARPHTYVLLGGDLIDSATVMSVASPYDNTGEPIQQVREVVALLKPLQPRILASVGGNHERRTVKTFGDSGSLIAEMLHIPYSRGVQHVDIHYGAHRPFKVSLWHGGGAARSKGAKAQMLDRFMSQGDSQLYLVGHLHDAFLQFKWKQERSAKGIVLRKTAGIMSSSFQSYWNTYAEVSGMDPSDTMMGRVILDAKGGWEVTMR